MSNQSMVFGPDQEGESVVIYIEDGSVQNVVLRNADEQQIPYEDLSKEHWTKMGDAEDRALEQIERQAALPMEVSNSAAEPATAVEQATATAVAEPAAEAEPAVTRPAAATTI